MPHVLTINLIIVVVVVVVVVIAYFPGIQQKEVMNSVYFSIFMYVGRYKQQNFIQFYFGDLRQQI